MGKSSPQMGQGQNRTVLILSDSKPGHVNQSIAFVRLLGLDYVVRRVSYRNRLCKVLSYLADRLHLSLSSLFSITDDLPKNSLVVSAGSDTYYPNRVIARSLGARSVAIMLPRGYRYDFDLIVAQQHDQPPTRNNILTIPVNLSCPEPQGLVKRSEDRLCVSIIIGGASRHFQMDVKHVEKQIQQIFKLFPEADFLVTTSRRTHFEVESMVEEEPFQYRVIASRGGVNPVPDFLAISDYVFVTEDSTSMVSEAVSFGKANVEILPLVKIGKSQKIERMMTLLQQGGYLHVFDGNLGQCSRKVDLQSILSEVAR